MFIGMLPFWLFGQVTDDFSDGDFKTNPTWMGDTADFKVSWSTAVPEGQRPALQLDATGGGQSCLAVATSLSGELEWSFWIKMSLNTSSGNYSRFYLVADSDSLKGPLNGYFIQMGGMNDSVEFFRQDSLAMVSLLTLDTLFTGNSTNMLRLRITRTADGLWQFFGDAAGGSDLLQIGEIIEASYPSGNHFGWFCQYSSSNTTKFYLDDVYGGPLIVDTVPPGIFKVTALSRSEISIVFDEPVGPESAELEGNYTLNPGSSQPYSAIRLLELAEVHLFFEPGLENGITYSLDIHNIADLKGNVSDLLTEEVMYYAPSQYDIIFTEIMADPAPSAGLPEFEYLEIYNRSEVPIDLTGWKLIIGASEHEFMPISIHPLEYFILCHNDAVNSFQSYGRAIGFSSFSLSNNGTSLTLITSDSIEITYIDYDLSWYDDAIKSDGGYSLELIDINHPCLGPENWKASGHPDGGTPGRRNFNNAAIQPELQVDGICCVTSTILEVAFSAAIDSLSSASARLYNVEPGNLEVLSAIPLPPGFRHVRLVLGKPGQPGQICHLSIYPGLLDCIKESYPGELDAEFAWPEDCLPYDIVLNEILFNPIGDGVDYVELYNRSSKAIMLPELRLASVREVPPNPPDTQAVQITSDCISLLPGHYLVLTKDPETVQSQYLSTDPHAFLEMASFPSLNNDQGCILLMKGNEVIDGIHYSDDMHFIMLSSTEGVSLERICPDRLGDDPGNWHSAAGTAGFGTPGYQNSQYLEIWEDESSFSVYPDIFSPDSDGNDDQLGISYSFGEPGKLITILVFSSDGNLARTLVNNEMPGTSGILSWDGTMDDRTPAPEGIYIVCMEVLGMDGRTERHRKACVVARQR